MLNVIILSKNQYEPFTGVFMIPTVERLEVTNIAPFQTKNIIKFSKNGNKLLRQNGKGKTTLVESIEYSLFEAIFRKQKRVFLQKIPICIQLDISFIYLQPEFRQYLDLIWLYCRFKWFYFIRLCLSTYFTVNPVFAHHQHLKDLSKVIWLIFRYMKQYQKNDRMNDLVAKRLLLFSALAMIIVMV